MTGEISYQCSLKTCPDCGTVTEDTTSVCESCGFRYSRELSPEDMELLEKADRIHVRQLKGKTRLEMFYVQKDEGFVVADQKLREKINEMSLTFSGNIERIKNPKFIELIKKKGRFI